MAEAPRGFVTSNVLAGLLAPHPEIARKRVTLLYRMHDPAEAAQVVEKDYRDAVFNESSAKGLHVGTRLAVRQAEKTASEEAQGAGLALFGLLVTATVTDEERLDEVGVMVEDLGLGARLALRRSYGQPGGGLRRRPAPRAGAAPPPRGPPAAPGAPVNRRQRPRGGRCTRGAAAARVPGAAAAGATSTSARPPSGGRPRRQVCGLWPFAAGSGTPMVGVPVGRDIRTGATVCSDPVNWFRRAGLIANPSMLVLGMPGVGKSKLVAPHGHRPRLQGVDPIIPGDLKPDYVDMIARPRRTGGRSSAGARGASTCSDPGAAMAAAQRLTGEARRKLMADALGRRLTMVSALVGAESTGAW